MKGDQPYLSIISHCYYRLLFVVIIFVSVTSCGIEVGAKHEVIDVRVKNGTEKEQLDRLVDKFIKSLTPSDRDRVKILLADPKVGVVSVDYCVPDSGPNNSREMYDKLLEHLGDIVEK